MNGSGLYGEDLVWLATRCLQFLVIGPQGIVLIARRRRTARRGQRMRTTWR